MKERAEGTPVEGREFRQGSFATGAGEERRGGIGKQLPQVAEGTLRRRGEALEERPETCRGKAGSVRRCRHRGDLRLEERRPGRVAKEATDEVDVEGAGDGLPEEERLDR